MAPGGERSMTYCHLLTLLNTCDAGRQLAEVEQDMLSNS